MAIQFPANPGLNQVYVYGGVNYVWDGAAWTAETTSADIFTTDVKLVEGVITDPVPLIEDSFYTIEPLPGPEAEPPAPPEYPDGTQYDANAVIAKLAQALIRQDKRATDALHQPRKRVAFGYWYDNQGILEPKGIELRDANGVTTDLSLVTQVTLTTLGEDSRPQSADMSAVKVGDYLTLQTTSQSAYIRFVVREILPPDQLVTGEDVTNLAVDQIVDETFGVGGEGGYLVTLERPSPVISQDEEPDVAVEGMLWYKPSELELYISTRGTTDPEVAGEPLWVPVGGAQGSGGGSIHDILDNMPAKIDDQWEFIADDTVVGSGKFSMSTPQDFTADALFKINETGGTKGHSFRKISAGELIYLDAGNLLEWGLYVITNFSILNGVGWFNCERIVGYGNPTQGDTFDIRFISDRVLTTNVYADPQFAADLADFADNVLAPYETSPYSTVDPLVDPWDIPQADLNSALINYTRKTQLVGLRGQDAVDFVTDTQAVGYWVRTLQSGGNPYPDVAEVWTLDSSNNDTSNPADVVKIIISDGGTPNLNGYALLDTAKKGDYFLLQNLANNEFGQYLIRDIVTTNDPTWGIIRELEVSVLLNRAYGSINNLDHCLVRVTRPIFLLPGPTQPIVSSEGYIWWKNDTKELYVSTRGDGEVGGEQWVKIGPTNFTTTEFQGTFGTGKPLPDPATLADGDFLICLEDGYVDPTYATSITFDNRDIAIVENGAYEKLPAPTFPAGDYVSKTGGDSMEGPLTMTGADKRVNTLVVDSNQNSNLLLNHNGTTKVYVGSTLITMQPDTQFNNDIVVKSGNQIKLSGGSDIFNFDANSNAEYLGATTATNHVATKGYVDGALPDVSLYLPLTGGTLTGELAINRSSGKAIVLQKSGVEKGAIWPDGTFTTTRTDFSGNHLVTKNYVDGAITSNAPNLSLYLPLTGGTLSGNLTLGVEGTADDHAVTKAYVDAKFEEAGGPEEPGLEDVYLGSWTLRHNGDLQTQRPTGSASAGDLFLWHINPNGSYAQTDPITELKAGLATSAEAQLIMATINETVGAGEDWTLLIVQGGNTIKYNATGAGWTSPSTTWHLTGQDHDGPALQANQTVRLFISRGSGGEGVSDIQSEWVPRGTYNYRRSSDSISSGQFKNVTTGGAVNHDLLTRIQVSGKNNSNAYYTQLGLRPGSLIKFKYGSNAAIYEITGTDMDGNGAKNFYWLDLEFVALEGNPFQFTVNIGVEFYVRSRLVTEELGESTGPFLMTVTARDVGVTYAADYVGTHFVPSVGQTSTGIVEYPMSTTWIHVRNVGGLDHIGRANQAFWKCKEGMITVLRRDDQTLALHGKVTNVVNNSIADGWVGYQLDRIFGDSRSWQRGSNATTTYDISFINI